MWGKVSTSKSGSIPRLLASGSVIFLLSIILEIQMRKSVSRLSLLILTGSIALLMTSCGTNKITQCDSIAEITDKAQVVASNLSKLVKSKTTDPNTIINAFDNLSTNMRKLSKDVQLLEIQDRKLKSFQSRSSTIYSDYAQAINVLSSLLKSESQNENASNKAMTNLNTVLAKEKTLANEFNSYCKTK
jgi:hypothetical protein